MATTYDVILRVRGPRGAAVEPVPRDSHTAAPTVPGDARPRDDGEWSLTPDPEHPGALALMVTVLADDTSMAATRARELAPGLLAEAGLGRDDLELEDVSVRMPG